MLFHEQRVALIVLPRQHQVNEGQDQHRGSANSDEKSPVVPLLLFAEGGGAGTLDGGD